MCVVTASAFAASAARAQITPTTVDEICPPAADPCIIAQVVDVDDLPIDMDFGTRTVRIVPGGQLRLGSNFRRVHCGRFEVDTPSLAVHMVEPVQPGAAISGDLEVRAYRVCSDDGSVRCIADADCTAGTCSVGDGGISFGGVVNGRATVSGNLTLIAAGAVDVPGKILLSGLTSQPEGQTDGGDLTIAATAGPVSITGRYSANGSGGGGRLTVTSGSDVTIDASLNTEGGSFPGDVVITAGGDVSLDGRHRGSVQLDFGFGTGDIDIDAGGGVALGVDKFRADIRGGQLDVTAGSDVVVYERASINARGANDGGAGDIALTSGDGIEIRGKLTAGGGSGVSLLSLQAANDILLTDRARLKASSRNSGGTITVGAASIIADGTLSTTAGSGGAAGSITLAGGDVSIGGRMTVIGDSGTSGVEMTGCDVELRPGASVFVAVPGEGVHTVTNEQLTISATSTVTAPTGGAHSFEYRSDGPAPIILGVVAPAPSIVPLALPPCP